MVSDDSIGDTQEFDEEFEEESDEGGFQPGTVPKREMPKSIGRYQIKQSIGKGGFGEVYLAYDNQLFRQVALKVPHERHIQKPKHAEQYLVEARTVASLDHPNIVPVFDVGETEELPFYLVSKYIDGASLSSFIRRRRLEPVAAAGLVATIADALHHAHKQGVVHRDVKPGNILLDEEGTPFIVDFGLALSDQSPNSGPKYMGTPAYMSPEQARGEGHRVDGRSDIFGLGVVLYELLTGTQPFQSKSRSELLDLITRCEPRPLRQRDEQISIELERICAKAMAKRIPDRYSSAYDLAQDLWAYSAESEQQASGTTANQSAILSGPFTRSANDDTLDRSEETQRSSASETPSSGVNKNSWNSSTMTMIPKGLRSFDAHDAEFFLELLPGPRDRTGMPESIRFWKAHIQATDRSEHAPVSLIYGPSGCGKSSFVRAGLLPVLDDDIETIYVEAAASHTEQRLLRALQHRFEGLGRELDLKTTLAELRRGRSLQSNERVLLVVDQLEQWLHAKGKAEGTELVEALRQCDGHRLQCLVLVRDDFWMAATRFMRELEVPLVEGRNSSGIDLFPVKHARKVLASFGRAFGALPEQPHLITKEQVEFLSQAADGLSQDELVICVRLALFAEMMKHKDWTPSSLAAVGGTKGVGATFLEETFSASTAPPKHRFHQKSARSVLKALLPEKGSQIKGNMKSRDELLAVSGYQANEVEFDELVEILDQETRLITPTDPNGLDEEAGKKDGLRYYQLTHDYLVPALRDWLTRKQQETRRGRAELRLAARSHLWADTKENRHLPSFLEWARIRLLVDRSKWTKPQQQMMRKSTAVHGSWMLVFVIALGLILAGGRWLSLRQAEQERIRSTDSLLTQLESASTVQVADLIERLEPNRDIANDKLETRLAGAEDDSTEKLHYSLALLPDDPSQSQFLVSRLPYLSPATFRLVTDAIPDDPKEFEPLWSVGEDVDRPALERFRAYVALAPFAKEDPRWQEASGFVADTLTGSIPSIYFVEWFRMLEVSKAILEDRLFQILSQPQKYSETSRGRAAVVLAEYFRDQPSTLVRAILQVDDSLQHKPILESISLNVEDAKSELASILFDSETSTDLETTRPRIETLAIAAVTLLQLDPNHRAWTLLEHSYDPGLRSGIIKYARLLRLSDQLVLARLESESEISIRRALIQILGGLPNSSQAQPDDERVVQTLIKLYENDPDPGIHGAAASALRTRDIDLPEVEAGFAEIGVDRARRIARWDREIASIKGELESIADVDRQRFAEWCSQLADMEPAPPGVYSDEQIKMTFDDPSQPLLNESSRDDYEYVGSSQLVLEDGVRGKAFVLAGQDSVDCGNAFSPSKEQAFSYGCWIKTDQADQYSAVLSKLDVAGGGVGFDLWLQGGKPSMHLMHSDPDNRIKVVGAQAIRAGTWHHLFVTYDGSAKADGVEIYLDGVQQEATALDDDLSGSIKNSAPFHIGKRFSEGSIEDSYSFKGLIDEVRIFDRSLIPADVDAIYQEVLADIARIEQASRTPDQVNVLKHAFRWNATKPLADELVEAERARYDSRWEGVKRWYVGKVGQEMVVICDASRKDAGRFEYVFAIGANEITVEQYRQYQPGAYFDNQTVEGVLGPMNEISWWDAARFCNWLSLQEGMTEDDCCYWIVEEAESAGTLALKPDYLDKPGYRLPTEAEWKYACVANADTLFCCGDSTVIAAEYAWLGTNSGGIAHSAGQRLPNDFGIFDMHGNLWEWNLESAPLEAYDDVGKLLLGGDFGSPPNSASRYGNSAGPPGYDGNRYGFRVVRKID